MKAIWNGQTIAESSDIVTVERNAYFPADAIRAEFFTPSTHTSACPWKGIAHYHSLPVDGAVNENAAWFYPNPKPAAAEIKGRVAFWKGVSIAE